MHSGRSSTSISDLSVRPRHIDATDEVLLAQVARGERDAFGHLYDRVGSAVYGVARRVVLDETMAQDVTQDVMLAVWSKASTFDTARGSVRAWILTLTHRRAVDVVRSEQAARNRTQHVAGASLEQPCDAAAQTVVEDDLAQSKAGEVTEALGGLTPTQRSAIELAYFGGLTYLEVARRLQVPLGTAKTRIRDGLRRLAVQLDSGPDEARPLRLP